MPIKVETKLDYIGGITFHVDGVRYPGSLFHRKIRYSDGSVIGFYGIEINRDHFMELKDYSRLENPLREGDTW